MAGPTTTISVQVDGVELQVEAVPIAGSEQTSALDRAQDAVAEAFDRAQDAIVAIGSSTVATIDRLRRRAVGPEEVQVKFGLKFTAKGNVIVAGASGEATLEVLLTYRRTPSSPPSTVAFNAASGGDEDDDCEGEAGDGDAGQGGGGDDG